MRNAVKEKEWRMKMIDMLIREISNFHANGSNTLLKQPRPCPPRISVFKEHHLSVDVFSEIIKLNAYAFKQTIAVKKTIQTL